MDERPRLGVLGYSARPHKAETNPSRRAIRQTLQQRVPLGTGSEDASDVGLDAFVAVSSLSLLASSRMLYNNDL